MYTKYFGFNEKPFTLTPNPRFIYLSNNHKEAFAHLLYGINSHYGFIELIGEVGTGKTTVLRTLLNQLHDESYRTALIFNPCLTGVELLKTICHEFGVSSKSEYANELLSDFNNFLLSETSQGRTVVLVIDESQNLQPDVLEQIRLISNLETENDKLIQIVLAGQPELGELLERPELRQLNQRIAVRYRLKSMSMLETLNYIRHRMEVAGETGGVSFSLFATRWIYLYTRGVPRMINILSDRCLLIAYGNERRRITAGVVTKAIRELINIPQSKNLTYAFIALICTVIAVVILGYNTSGWRKHYRENTTTPFTSKSETKTQEPVKSSIPALVTAKTSDTQFLRFMKEIQSYDHDDFSLIAFNAIADRFGTSQIAAFSEQIKIPETYSRLAAKRNLRITEFKGNLDEVIRFELPFFVLTKITDNSGSYCIAVTSVTKDAASIAPLLFEKSTISKSDLNLITAGTYYLVWQNKGKIPDKIILGEKRIEIKKLQMLLQRSGNYSDVIDGYYGVVTAKAVSDFQRKSGIPQNEKVGELTLAALAKYHANQKDPAASPAGGSK